MSLIITVVDVITGFDNPKAPLAKLIVDLNENFRMQVPIWKNGNGDEHGEYPPYAILPFQYTYEYKYNDENGTENTRKNVGYHLDIRPYGEEDSLESANLWENIKSALVAGYLVYTGQYNKYFQEHKKRLKSNSNYSYRGCDNCRFRTMKEVTEERDTGFSQSRWRNVCALTRDTLDDDYFKLENTPEETGHDHEKGTIAVKHLSQDADYKHRVYKKETLKRNALRDEGNGCWWHRYFSTLQDGKGFFSERTAPFLPIDREEYCYHLPYDIVVDFAPVFIKKEEEDNIVGEVGETYTFNKELLDMRAELNDKMAEKIARLYAIEKGFDEEQTRRFAKAYVELGK